MAKKVSIAQPRKTGRSTTDERVRARLEEQFQRKMEKVRLHLAEHQKNIQMEEGLHQLQYLKYEPVDYTPLLEKTPWEAPPLSCFAFLKSEAIQRVENFYRQKLKVYGISLGATLALFLVLPKGIALLLFMATGLLLVYMVSQTLKTKQQDLIQTLEEAQQEIYRRQKEEQQEHEELRKRHEFNEGLRIAKIEGILEGEPGVYANLLKEKLEEMKFPVYVQVLLEVSGPAVNATLLAPELNVIPKAWTRLSGEGYIEYDEKSDREVHQQYFDLMAAALVHSSLEIFRVAPSIDVIYVRAIDKDCVLMHSKLTREMVENEGNGVLADFIKQTDFIYAVDPQFRLLAIDEPKQAEAWNEGKEIFKATARIFK